MKKLLFLFLLMISTAAFAQRKTDINNQTTGFPLTAAHGGTGQTTYTLGDMIYASGATALSILNDVATGNALISGGVGAAPSWGKIGLTTHVTGLLPNANLANPSMTVNGTTCTLGSSCTVTGGGTVASGGQYTPIDVPPTSAATLNDEFNSGSFDTIRWQFINQGTSTAVVSNGMVAITPQINAGADNIVAIVQSVPGSTPWTVTAKIGMTVKGTSNSQFGITLYDGTKFIIFAIDVGTATLKYTVTRYTNTTTFSSQPLALTINSLGLFTAPFMFFRVTDDGTNNVYSVSKDGSNFTVLLTELRGAFLTATKVGLAAECTGAGEVMWGVADWFRN